MVHSKQELNQLTRKLRKLSNTVLPDFMILLLEEVTTPPSLEALYSHFILCNQVDREQKGGRKIDQCLAVYCQNYKITGRAFEKVNIHLANLINLV